MSFCCGSENEKRIKKRMQHKNQRNSEEYNTNRSEQELAGRELGKYVFAQIQKGNYYYRNAGINNTNFYNKPMNSNISVNLPTKSQVETPNDQLKQSEKQANKTSSKIYNYYDKQNLRKAPLADADLSNINKNKNTDVSAAPILNNKNKIYDGLPSIEYLHQIMPGIQNINNNKNTGFSAAQVPIIINNNNKVKQKGQQLKKLINQKVINLLNKDNYITIEKAQELGIDINDKGFNNMTASQINNFFSELNTEINGKEFVANK